MAIPIYITCPYCRQTANYEDVIDVDEEGYFSGNVTCSFCKKVFHVTVDKNQPTSVSAQ